MRRLFTPRMLLAALAVLAGSLLAPTAASALPGTAGTDAAAAVKGAAPSFAPSTTPTVGTPLKPTRVTAVNSLFSCSYGGVAPFYSVNFQCTVSTGSIKLYLDCTDYPRIFSEALPAPGTYTLSGICGPPRQVLNFGVVDA
jgi:hypothetical protein